MVHGGEERVGVRRKIDTCGTWLQVEDSTNKGWILMRESIMFLSGPGAGFEVVDAANILSPGGFTCLRCDWVSLDHTKW
jgi:hypothetical protein